jgi:hypothetical protein
MARFIHHELSWDESQSLEEKDFEPSQGNSSHS